MELYLWYDGTLQWDTCCCVCCTEMNVSVLIDLFVERKSCNYELMSLKDVFYLPFSTAWWMIWEVCWSLVNRSEYKLRDYQSDSTLDTEYVLLRNYCVQTKIEMIFLLLGVFFPVILKSKHSSYNAVFLVVFYYMKDLLRHHRCLDLKLLENFITVLKHFKDANLLMSRQDLQ